MGFLLCLTRTYKSTGLKLVKVEIVKTYELYEDERNVKEDAMLLKDRIQKIAKYLFITVCVVYSVIFLGTIASLFYAYDSTLSVPYEISSKRVPVIYKKAGFKGEISHLENQSNLHNQRMSYTYTEKVGQSKMTYHFVIGIDKNKKEPTYTYNEIVDLYTGHYSDSYERDSQLFSEFFDVALFKNEKMDLYRRSLEQSLEASGLENVKVEIDEWSGEAFSANVSDLNQELKKDLQEANKNGAAPVLGINTLDPFKYFSMGSTTLHISTDSDISYFEDHAKKIEHSQLKAGYYVVSENQSSYYSNYYVSKNLEWENITFQD